MVARMSFSYSEDHKDKLKILAKKSGRSLSGYVQRVLKNHLIDKGLIPEEDEELEKQLKQAKRKVKNDSIKG